MNDQEKGEKLREWAGVPANEDGNTWPADNADPQTEPETVQVEIPGFAPLKPFWSADPFMAPNGEPAVLVTIRNAAFPLGIPFMFTRDLGLKFASDVKKALNTGPKLIEARSQLIVPS